MICLDIFMNLPISRHRGGLTLTNESADAAEKPME